MPPQSRSPTRANQELNGFALDEFASLAKYGEVEALTQCRAHIKALLVAFERTEQEMQQASVTYQPAWLPGGKTRLHVRIAGGEYYRVNCPFCNDTRKRLYFHYLWASRMPAPATT